PSFTKNTQSFDRRQTLWAAAPSVGIVPDYADKGEGVRLDGVVRNTPAARASLKKGDRVVALGGKAVKDAAAYHSLARALPAGQKVELTLVRDGKQQKLALQLTPAPGPGAHFRLGIVVDPVDTKDGLLLTRVQEGGPAARAGIKAGDRLVAIAGDPVRDAAAYFGALRDMQPGAKVEVTVRRA